MAKPTAYTAEHQGFTFTRKSHRTYTHAVLLQGSVAADRERCRRDAHRYWHTNLEYHQHAADGLPCPGSRYTVTPDQQAQSKAILEAGEDGYVAQRLAQHDSRAKPSTLADGDTYFTCAGWCGRLDLAGKLAGQHAGSVIVEAVTK